MRTLSPLRDNLKGSGLSFRVPSEPLGDHNMGLMFILTHGVFVVSLLVVLKEK